MAYQFHRLLSSLLSSAKNERQEKQPCVRPVRA